MILRVEDLFRPEAFAQEVGDSVICRHRAEVFDGYLAINQSRLELSIVHLHSQFFSILLDLALAAFHGIRLGI